ncbi:MAG: FxDxF family PEP-CTERM protein [Thiobacillaceae bacterium]
MFRTKFLLGLILAGLAGSAAAVGPGTLGNLTGQTFSVGNTFSAGAAIYDVYTFDIMPLSAVAGTAVTINLDIPELTGTEFAISSFGVQFRDSSNNLIVSDYQTSPTDYTVALTYSLPAATGYQFVVVGNVTGTLGGSYGGALAAVATPVPEPEGYMTMLAGLGLMGFVVLRRNTR